MQYIIYLQPVSHLLFYREPPYDMIHRNRMCNGFSTLRVSEEPQGQRRRAESEIGKGHELLHEERLQEQSALWIALAVDRELEDAPGPREVRPAPQDAQLVGDLQHAADAADAPFGELLARLVDARGVDEAT